MAPEVWSCCRSCMVVLPEQSVREPEASQGVQHMCEEEQGACKEGRECDVVSEGGIQSRRCPWGCTVRG